MGKKIYGIQLKRVLDVCRFTTWVTNPILPIEAKLESEIHCQRQSVVTQFSVRSVEVEPIFSAHPCVSFA